MNPAMKMTSANHGQNRFSATLTLLSVQTGLFKSFKALPVAFKQWVRVHKYAKPATIPATGVKITFYCRHLYSSCSTGAPSHQSALFPRSGFFSTAYIPIRLLMGLGRSLFGEFGGGHQLGERLVAAFFLMLRRGQWHPTAGGRMKFNCASPPF